MQVVANHEKTVDTEVYGLCHLMDLVSGDCRSAEEYLLTVRSSAEKIGNSFFGKVITYVPKILNRIEFGKLSVSSGP